MANYLIHRIEFIANNTFGEFVAGDVLEVFLDDGYVVPPSNDVSDGVTVEKNGSPLVSSSTLIDNNPSVIIKETYGVSFCSSTYLVTTKLSYTFPFGRYTTTADHPSCAITPTVCDLIVVGQPTVTNATGATTADGAVTVVATSSNTIEYKLTPFSYGSGQSSGTFTGLIPGTHRVWLADSKNCITSVLVQVGVSYTYGEKYILEYDDLNGFQTKVLIKEKSYVGASTEVCGSAEPFTLSLRGEGSDNKFEPVIAVQGNLNLTSETDSQFLELYTNDPDLYRVEYYKDFGSGYVQYNTLKLLPQQYQEDYKFPPYYVNTVCTDGLPNLKDLYLIQEDGQRYYGSISLIKLVALVLKPLALDLDILVACNLYADGMDTTATDDPFDQAYVDFEAIYLKESFPTYDFVLRSVLEPFGCRVVQWENRWNIIRVEELKDDFDYRIFDYNGVYSSNGTYTPVKSIGTDVIFSNADQFLEIRPGYGNIKVNYNLGLRPNILKNGDFRLKGEYNEFFDANYSIINKDGWTLVNAGYPISESYEKLENLNVAYVISSEESILENTEGGNAYLQSDTYSVAMGSNNQLKISLNVKVSRLTGSLFGLVFTINVPYVKVRVRVKYGSLYLMADGTWTATENILTFHLAEFNKYTSFEILANQPTSGTPTAGMDLDVRVYHAYAYHADYDSIANLKSVQTYNAGQVLPTGYRTELRDDFTLPSKIYYYELEETTAADNSYYVVRPNDYAASTNEREWVLKHSTNGTTVGSATGINVFPMAIDFIKIEYLSGGEAPFDSIIRTAKGEANNKAIFEKDLIFGSASNLISTEVYFDYGIPKSIFEIALKTVPSTITISTVNILSSSLIYAGQITDSAGDGFEYWTRDGVAESEKLHGIFLKQYAAQYKRSWRLLRGSIRNNNSFFGLLNVIEESNGLLYLPISLTLDDKNCMTSGEFLELVVGDIGSDGTAEAPFNSGFTTGFGSSGFN